MKTTTTTTLTTEQRSQVELQLAAYGYTLSPDGEIVRGTKALKVRVSANGARFIATSMIGVQHKLWSGPDIGDFVSRFWCAVRVSL